MKSIDSLCIKESFPRAVRTLYLISREKGILTCKLQLEFLIPQLSPINTTSCSLVDAVSFRYLLSIRKLECDYSNLRNCSKYLLLLLRCSGNTIWVYCMELTSRLLIQLHCPGLCFHGQGDQKHRIISVFETCLLSSIRECLTLF